MKHLERREGWAHAKAGSVLVSRSFSGGGQGERTRGRGLSREDEGATRSARGQGWRCTSGLLPEEPQWWKPDSPPSREAGIPGSGLQRRSGECPCRHQRQRCQADVTVFMAFLPSLFLTLRGLWKIKTAVLRRNSVLDTVPCTHKPRHFLNCPTW